MHIVAKKPIYYGDKNININEIIILTQSWEHSLQSSYFWQSFLCNVFLISSTKLAKLVIILVKLLAILESINKISFVSLKYQFPSPMGYIHWWTLTLIGVVWWRKLLRRICQNILEAKLISKMVVAHFYYFRASVISFQETGLLRDWWANSYSNH